jgi:hypothetical protein
VFWGTTVNMKSQLFRTMSERERERENKLFLNSPKVSDATNSSIIFAVGLQKLDSGPNSFDIKLVKIYKLSIWIQNK